MNLTQTASHIDGIAKQERSQLYAHLERTTLECEKTVFTKERNEMLQLRNDKVNADKERAYAEVEEDKRLGEKGKGPIGYSQRARAKQSKDGGKPPSDARRTHHTDDYQAPSVATGPSSSRPADVYPKPSQSPSVAYQSSYAGWYSGNEGWSSSSSWSAYDYSGTPWRREQNERQPKGGQPKGKGHKGFKGKH